ncbi:MAG: hypothetical protein J6Z49_08770 [Kiritimatiellae bacterium]|nr:hypothetical protein [Kiritimatiellia bacterium]
MKVVSPLNPAEPLTDLSSWRAAFVAIDKKQCHWKEGRSACSLARFFLSGRGEAEIVSSLNSIFSDDAVECLDRGEIECLCPFDTYRNPRRQDMGIWGRTKKGHRFFVGVEAKVDEPFSDDTLGSVYEKARKTKIEKPKSHALDRLNGLCDWFGVMPDDEMVRSFRYQLFHFTKGTADVMDVDIRVMLLLTFRTSEYDTGKGEGNAADWKAFLNRFFVPVAGGYRLNIDKCPSQVFAVEKVVDQLAREEHKR